MSGIDQFLRELRDSGKIDSGGIFTIDLQKSSTKLNKHLLRGPADYLLVGVRGAVAAGASAVSIKLHYRESRIELKLDNERADDLALDLMRVADQRQRGAHLLRLAMGGAFTQEASEVEVRSPSWCLTADGESLKGRAHAGREGFLTIDFRWRFGGFLGLRGRTAQEHKELSERCTFSVVPIELDGRRLTAREARIPAGSHEWTDLPMDFRLAEGFLRYGEDELTIKVDKAPVGALYDGFDLVHRDPHWRAEHGGVMVRTVQDKYDAYFCLSGVAAKGRLFVVKDGVCLEPLVSRRWLRGSVLVVKAESVETDAGELKPRESEEYKAVQEWAVGVNHRMGELLTTELSLLEKIGPRLWKRALFFAGVGFVNGLPGGPVCASVMGGVGALLGVVLFRHSSGKDKQAVEEMLSQYDVEQAFGG